MPKEAQPRNLPLFTEEEVQERLHVLLAGVAQYNDGYFFEAHETLEELWMQSPWPIRRFLQGLIQLAAAFVHLVRHEYPGTVRLLGHAIEKLHDFAPRYMDIDVETLIAGASSAREALLSLGPERFEEWPRSGIPQIQFVPEKPKARRRAKM
jgi:predicted metal-dependent hydrolase